MVEIVEKLVCRMYGHTIQNDVDSVRFLIFDDKSKPTKNKAPLESIKSIDPARFSPCKRVLLQHMRHAWFIARLYKTACEAHPAMDFSPIHYGWKLSECKDFYDIDWFDGDQLPETVETMDENEEEGNVESEIEESDESDSEDED